MTDSAQLILWQGLFYALGALGLFAIGALPLRTYAIARQLRAAARPAWLLLGVLAVALCAAAVASPFLAHLGRCLLGYHCSANAAGGWINAAFLGAIYAVFEVLVFVLLLVGQRRRVAT
jgi:hypothetical protein